MEKKQAAQRRTVLFVDDEYRILTSLQRALLDEPYKKLYAESGKQALEMLEQEEVHVIVTDMRMPEMTGLDLLRTVKEKHPHVVRMVLSGYTQITTLLSAINQGEIYRYITKPWRLEDEFKPAVRQAVEYYERQNEQTTAAPATGAAAADNAAT